MSHDDTNGQVATGPDYIKITRGAEGIDVFAAHDDGDEWRHVSLRLDQADALALAAYLIEAARP